jgi:type II secretory pathway pseudopilin PulG
MSDKNSKSNINSKITIAAIIILVIALIFFFITKNASDQVSKVLEKVQLNNKSENIVQSSVVRTTTKYIPSVIDKADILFKKPGAITWEDIFEVSPEEQKTLYSGFTQEQKDNLVKTWNDLKTTTGGDPAKARG